VIFSCSISRSASPASHFDMITMARPMTKLLSITGTSPVTWNKGTLSSVRGGLGSRPERISTSFSTISPVA
jgi:hypothetical protein